MLNQAGLEATYMIAYVENYIDAMENLANSIQPHISEVRRLDIDYIFTRLIEIKETLSTGELISDERNRLINEIQELLYRGQLNGDEKLEHMYALNEVIAEKCEQLDRDFANLEPSQSEPPTKQTQASIRRSLIDGGMNIGQPSSSNTNACASFVPDGRFANESSRNRQKRPRNSRLPPDLDEKDDNSDGNNAKKRTNARNGRSSRKKRGGKSVSNLADPNEPTYCLCEQISFGDMIGCDYGKCPIEWFHFECVDLKTKPKGKWFCPQCRGDRGNVLKATLAGK